MNDALPRSLLEATSRATHEGALCARDQVREAIERLQASAHLRACTELLADEALDRATEIDARRRRGGGLGRLAGVPFAVKANIATRQGHTDCASRLLRGYASPFDASAVERLLAEDAVLVAKTNCDEFGMGSSTERSSWGPTLHPEDPARVPGGSSGGSAVAVSSRGGALPLALGSDTGGSLRQPASFCGAVGVKATYGRVSRWGLVAFASSMDQVGPLCTRVRDAAQTLEIIAGPDGRDARCLPSAPGSFLAACERGASGLRVGIVRELLDSEEIAPPARQLVGEAALALEGADAQVDVVDVPAVLDAIAIYALVANAEASSNLARFDGVRFGRRSASTDTIEELFERTRAEGFGQEVKRRILLGTLALSAERRDEWFSAARRARARLTAALDRALSDHDLLLTPTTPGEPFKAGERLESPLQMYRSDLCTLPASLGGHPALSIPGPRTSPRALPLGVQLVARRGDEETLFAAACALEDEGFRP